MVLSIGVIYSLPNLYPAKPAIQIAYTDSGKSADQILLNQVQDILEDQSTGVESVGLKDNNIIARFNSFDEQLAGKAALQKILLDEAVVALNLETKTFSIVEVINPNLACIIAGGNQFKFNTQPTEKTNIVWEN